MYYLIKFVFLLHKESCIQEIVFFPGAEQLDMYMHTLGPKKLQGDVGSHTVMQVAEQALGFPLFSMVTPSLNGLLYCKTNCS